MSLRVAVVTGAARGIGAATVRGLAAAGWAVVAVDRGSDDPQAPLPDGKPGRARGGGGLGPGRCRPSGRPGHRGERIVARLADATDPEALAAVVADAEERFGGLDAMVAVAGVIAGGVPLWEMPADQLDAVLGVDLGGPINAARVGIPGPAPPTPAPIRSVPGRGLGRRHPWPPDAVGLRRRQGRRGRPGPGAGRRAGRLRHHRQRRQPGVDGHRHAGRERPPLRPDRHHAPSPSSSRSSGC